MLGQKRSFAPPTSLLAKDHAWILVCVMRSLIDHPILPMPARRENAAHPQSRYHKHLPYSAEDRTHHKESTSKFVLFSGNLRTSENPAFYTHHRKVENLNLIHPILFYIKHISSSY